MGYKSGNGQSLTISLPDTTAIHEDTLVYPITVLGFERISTFQFSMQWDPAVISYLDTLSDGVENLSIGTSDADRGILVVSWFANNGLSETLADQSTLFEIRFLPNGNLGDTTTLRITNEPRAIQIAQLGESVDQFQFLSVEDGRGQITIGEANNFAIAASASPVTCFGGNDGKIQLVINNREQLDRIVWSGPENFQSTAESLEGLIAGSYQYQAFSMTNELIASGAVSVEEPLEGIQITSIEVNEILCPGANGSILVNSIGGEGQLTYHLEGTIQAEPFFEIAAPGNYLVEVIDTNGCIATDSFEMAMGPPLAINLGVDQTICVGQEVILDVGAFAAILWSTGDSVAALKVEDPGTYSVTVTNTEGCIASDTIEISDRSTFDISIEQDDFMVCPGDGMELRVNGGTEFRWIDTSGTLSRTDIADPIATPTYLTTYIVIASDECQTDTLMTTLDLFEKATTAGPDTCVSQDSPITLFAAGGEAYEWIPGTDVLDDAFIANPTVSPTESQDIIVIITDENNCAWRDTVHVELVTDPTEVFLPNLITPNGDGKNDFLEFPGITKFGVNTIRVYNRWGDLVYQKLNYMLDEDRFDGRYKNEPLPAGNYYYELAFRTNSFKQTLTIIRE